MSQQTEAGSSGHVAVVVTHYHNARDLATCLVSLAADGGSRVREVVVCDSEACRNTKPSSRRPTLTPATSGSSATSASPPWSTPGWR